MVLPQRPVGPDMNLSKPNYLSTCLVCLENNFCWHLIETYLVLAVSALLKSVPVSAPLNVGIVLRWYNCMQSLLDEKTVHINDNGG